MGKVFVVQLGPRFACGKCPENESHMCTMAVLSRPDTDIKSNATGLFHCVHSAARQLSKLYCKHCMVLFSLSIILLSTFSPWELFTLTEGFKVYFGGGSLPSTLFYQIICSLLRVVLSE